MATSRNDGQGESYWIGRGAQGGRGDGTCIIRDDFNSLREDFEGTAFSKGDIAIAVEWYDRDPSDPDGKTFVRWDPVAAGNAPDTRFVLTSTELRMIDFEMREKASIQPPLGVVRRTRRAVHRAATPSERALYELPDEVHAAIIAEVWPF